MATPNSGGDSAPVKIFPTGFDFSNFTIISVPGTAVFEWYAIHASQADDETNGPPDRLAGAAGDGDTNSVPPGWLQSRSEWRTHDWSDQRHGLVWNCDCSVGSGRAYGALDSISINNNDASVAVGSSTQFGPFNSTTRGGSGHNTNEQRSLQYIRLYLME